MIFASLSFAVLSLIALVQFGAQEALWPVVFGLAQTVMISVALPTREWRRARISLQTYSVILAAISLLVFGQSIAEGTAQSPYLVGSDGEAYFAQALVLADGDILQRLQAIGSNYFGYQTVLAFLFQSLGESLLVGLLANNSCLVLAAILLVRTTHLLTRDYSAAFWAGLAFMLTAKFIFYSNVLLKEPFLVLGVGLTSYAFALLKISRAKLFSAAGAVIAIVLAALIFGTMRQPMLAVIAAALLLQGRGFNRGGWMIAAISVISFGTLGSLFAGFTSYEFSGSFISNQALQNNVLEGALNSGVDSTGFVGRFMGNYNSWPMPVRIVALPLAVIVQFFLPFNFWSIAFADDHIAFLFSENLNFVWYLFVGVFVLFTLARWRGLPNNDLRNLFGLGVAMYVLVAFVYGGTVPRYADPYLVLMFPAVGHWMAEWRRLGPTAVRISNFFKSYYLSFGVAAVAYLVFQLSR